MNGERELIVPKGWRKLAGSETVKRGDACIMFESGNSFRVTRYGNVADLLCKFKHFACYIRKARTPKP